MLDATDIHNLAKKHSVSGDLESIVALVRDVEHISVAEAITCVAMSFANPKSIMSDAAQAVNQLERRK
jgi:hypothetical protein